MEKLRVFLSQIGFGKNEIEVYTGLIGMDTASVLDIAKKTKLHRSNIYDALRNLVQQGLVYEVTGQTKLFHARPPKSLLDYIMNRKVELEQIVKDIETNHPSKKPTEKVTVSQGMFAVREALFSLLELKKDIAAYGIPESVPELIGPRLAEFHKERIKKGIKMRHIYNSNGTGRVAYLNSLANTEAKFFSSKYDSLTTTVICGEKILLIFWEDDSTIVEINDASIAEPYSNYFEILWKRAKA